MVFIDEKEVDSRLENEGCLFDWEEHDKQIRANERARVIDEILDMAICSSNRNKIGGCLGYGDICKRCEYYKIEYSEIERLIH